MPIPKAPKNSAAKLPKEEHELIDLYRQMAKEEGLEMIVREKGWPVVEFVAHLPSSLVLTLIDVRKRLGRHECGLSLPDVMERIAQDF